MEAVAVEEGDGVFDDGARLRKVTSGASVEHRLVSKGSSSYVV